MASTRLYPSYVDLPDGWSTYHIRGTWILPRVSVISRRSGFFALSVGAFRHGVTAIRKPPLNGTPSRGNE